MAGPLHARLADRLLSGRGDQGFGPRPNTPAEPEPTALAVIALDDEAGRTWLRNAQRPDGSLTLPRGVVMNDSPTSLAAIALGPGPAQDRAAQYLEHHLAITTASSTAIPLRGPSHGWAWVDGTFGWVEPTSRAVLALRLARRTSPALDDGIAVLTERQCEQGGWNYGNRTVWGTDLEPYVQTTAMGLLALQGPAAPDTAAAALSVLERQWEQEPGALSLALSLTALELHGRADPHRDRIVARLSAEFDETSFFDDTVATAWAAIATGDRWEQLQVTS